MSRPAIVLSRKRTTLGRHLKQRGQVLYRQPKVSILAVYVSLGGVKQAPNLGLLCIVLVCEGRTVIAAGWAVLHCPITAPKIPHAATF